MLIISKIPISLLIIQQFAIGDVPGIDLALEGTNHEFIVFSSCCHDLFSLWHGKERYCVQMQGRDDANRPQTELEDQPILREGVIDLGFEPNIA